MRIIADWVKPYNWKVYYNKKNFDGFPVFTSKGGGGKPDILITKNSYNVMVEAKPCEKHQDILNGVDQVIRYAGEYYTGRTKYFTKHEIHVDAFVLATKYSPSGYLYSLESALGFVPYLSLDQLYNMQEKPITHTTTRFLWRQWHKGLALTYYENFRRGKTSSEVNLPKKPYVGVMIAKTENNKISMDPYLYLNSNKFISLNYEQIGIFR